MVDGRSAWREDFDDDDWVGDDDRVVRTTRTADHRGVRLENPFRVDPD